MSNSESGLQYDELGFLVGLRQTSRDVSKIDKNVENIHDILLDLKKEFEQKYSNQQTQPRPRLSAFEQALLDAQIKPVDFADILKEQANPIVEATLAVNKIAKTIEELIDETESNNQSKIKRRSSTSPQRRAVEISSKEDVVREFGPQNRERGADGRFIGANSESQSVVNKVAQTLGTAIKGVLPSNPQGVDPTLDAINEVATVLSPVKRAAGFMIRPLTGWMKSRKRNEPLPKEQSDHNRRQIRLLQRLVDSNNGGGVFGLLRLLPIAIAGIGATVAAAVASLGPVLATAIAGVLGAYVGSKVHDTLEESETGQAVNNVIGNGATRLLAMLGNDDAKAAVEANDKAADAERYKDRKENPAWYSNDGVYRFARKLGLEGYMKEEKRGSLLYQQQYGGKGINSKTVAQFGAAANNTNSTAISKIVTAKAGNSNTVELVDGSVVKRTGNRNWRNNNPGNIEYGELAKKYGAIGSDGRFAIFPDYDSGRKAKEHLIFESNRAKTLSTGLDYGKGLGYKDKTLKQTIASYAPIEDNNNTFKYQRNVLAAVNGQNKKMSEYSAAERKKIMDAMEKEEGFVVGETKVLKNSSHVIQNKKLSSQTIALIKNSSASNEAEKIMQKVKPQVSMLSNKAAITPMASRSSNIAANFIPPKVETKVEPVKEYFTLPEPQKVQVTNLNNGNINQNVSNRMLAHAITGGLGMGDRWNG